ncbi:16S rRNA processing protein RimM [Granulicatella balaenopterae]|uniref:Ribosome maturation factor RimM n=1 Tax=Granulicatella balaenopterae TaxID=137733 RepID=A0A1H9H065_9LACT|nr:ribosome maturation factor RimM [Granulicatella balaenopterae]SEQ55711.1 16S rRNA processing protein RimM [Granulicatella balaenopterae]
MENYFGVGKIVNTQGLKGEVRVISRTDFAEERYQKGSKLRLFRDGHETLDLIVKSHRKHKNFDLLTFEGYPRIEDVEVFRDGLLKVAESDLSELEDDEFYYHEIVGLDIYTDEGELLGKVKEILSPGANDVWVVKAVAKGKKDILIPYIEPVVKEINLAEGKVVITVIEGLID